MERPEFSQMLVNRRRQLGLSVSQASNVLRLKEEVLIAFEEGDFNAIPKSGYAQGMLSSYARYLGLNAKHVVNQFSADLYQYNMGSDSSDARRQQRVVREEAPSAGQRRTQESYVASHGLLPTSGGYAGDLGEFATTSRPHRRELTQTYSGRGPGYTPERPYNARGASGAAGYAPLSLTQRQRPTSRALGQSSTSRYGMRDSVTTQRVAPAQYTDDMLLEEATSSTYDAASSPTGRRSSRNIASTARPNVRRRRSDGSRDQLRNRDAQRSQYGGLVGMLLDFFSDRTRVVALIIGLLAVVLTATIIFAAQSCVGANSDSGKTVTVSSSTQDDTNSDTSDSGLTAEEEEKARADAAAKTSEQQTLAATRTLTVAVAEGSVAWLEIECDGMSEIAETITGPWEHTYTAKQSMTINTDSTTAVSVTENGKLLEFETKASGIGSITVQASGATQQDTTGTVGASTTGGQGSAAQGTSAQTTAGSGVAQNGTATTTQQNGQATGQQVQSQNVQQNGQVQQDQQQGNTQSTGGTLTTSEIVANGYTLDTDGFYYGVDGYYDANGVFYSY